MTARAPDTRPDGMSEIRMDAADGRDVMDILESGAVVNVVLYPACRRCAQTGADWCTCPPARPRVAVRHFASATDERTVIASLLPPDVAVGANATLINVDHWAETGEIRRLEQPPLDEGGADS